MIAAWVAAVALRSIVFVDAGSRPVYSLQTGHAASNEWSAELLGFANALDVSEGREVQIGVDASDCRQDVRATFDDGTSVVLNSVDLCAASTVRITDP